MLDFELALALDRYAILRYYRRMCKELEISEKHPEVVELIHGYVAKLGVPPIVAFQAEELYHSLRDLPAIQNRPAYIVASSLIYAVGKVQLSQAQIAHVSGVHECTMRALLKLISDRLPDEL